MALRDAPQAPWRLHALGKMRRCPHRSAKDPHYKRVIDDPMCACRWQPRTEERTTKLETEVPHKDTEHGKKRPLEVCGGAASARVATRLAGSSISRMRRTISQLGWSDGFALDLTQPTSPNDVEASSNASIRDCACNGDATKRKTKKGSHLQLINVRRLLPTELDYISPIPHVRVNWQPRKRIGVESGPRAHPHVASFCAHVARMLQHKRLVLSKSVELGLSLCKIDQGLAASGGIPVPLPSARETS